MTGPIPIQQVQIHPQFVPQQRTPGIEMLVTALEHRRALQMEQKKLDLELQSFELHKKIAGSQLAGNELDNAKKQREMREHQLDLDARQEALGIVNGHLDVLRDPQSWGPVWARIKDPRVAGFVQQYRDDQLGSEQKAATLAGTQATTARTEQANATDAAVRKVLESYSGKLGNPQQQARAVGEIATLDPQAAGQLAQTFNSGNGRYQHVLAVTGEPYTFDSKTGHWSRQPGNLGTKAGALTNQEAQAVAQQAHDIVGRMEQLLQQNRNADAPSVFAQGARNVKSHGMIGAAIGTAEPLLLTAPQQEFSQLADNLLHLQASLLPRGQRSIFIMENLRSSFIAPGGAAASARASARRTRLDLDQRFFVPLSKGSNVDMRRFPGWTEAAQDALTPVAPQTATPDYESYRNGSPP